MKVSQCDLCEEDLEPAWKSREKTGKQFSTYALPYQLASMISYHCNEISKESLLSNWRRYWTDWNGVQKERKWIGIKRNRTWNEGKWTGRERNGAMWYDDIRILDDMRGNETKPNGEEWKEMRWDENLKVSDEGFSLWGREVLPKVEAVLLSIVFQPLHKLLWRSRRRKKRGRIHLFPTVFAHIFTRQRREEENAERTQRQAGLKRDELLGK